jgi:HlyD family secretion protein
MPLPRSARLALAGGIGALLVAGGAALLAWRASAVEVVRAQPTRLKQTVVVTGRVLLPAKVDIGATITARVRAVRVDEGDPVRADAVLVDLESTELAAALAQAVAAEQAARTRIAQWQAVGSLTAREQLAQAEVNYRNVERDAARQEQLFRQGFVGEARVDEARRALAVARSQLETARAAAAANAPSGVDRRLLEDQLAQARAARETAAAKLAQTTLHAPASGVVLDRNVEPGDIVQPGKRLLSLALDGEVRLAALIDEKNLALLNVGQTALVSADAFPDRRFNAVLAYLSPGVDLQRGTVEAKFSVPSPPPFLRADMTVSIDIAVADKPDALAIPVAAIRDPQSAEPWVLVLKEGRAVRQAVRMGSRAAPQVEVLAGVVAGDDVILTPGVTPGARVHAR